MKKKDGFPGQQSYVIPDKIVTSLEQSPVCSDLFLTDIGYYPNAKYHFRERKNGIAQNILIYNVVGEGELKVGDLSISIPADHFIIIPANTPHYYYANPKNPWSIYWIHFSGSKAKQIAKPILQPTAVEKTSTSRISERISLFQEIFYNLAYGFSLEILEYVNLCLNTLLASFTYLEQYRMKNEYFSSDPINRSINYMLENLSDKLKLDNIAKTVNLSASHFSRLFLQRTGHSPIDYFIQLKIQHSCKLLDKQSFSIAEIARSSGFDDQFYYARQFKKVMNMTPSQYRKR